MIHNSKRVRCADALHRIESGIDLLRLTQILDETYDQENFSLSELDLVHRLIRIAIAEIEKNLVEALHSIDFQTIAEIELEHRAMLESNSRSGDEKSAVNSSDG